ncbi:hypothetical protein CMI41_00865 [Candidatus Pacearchaeota archaeon]|nr:hypothetical protein [Candidatus Pacearchaeota archaeon]
MKTMFRKAVGVLASAALIGSTAAMAAAVAYPAPFNSGNSAVVYGAEAAESDMVAATSIQSDINAALVSDGSGETTVTGGDSYKIEKGKTLFHLGDTIGSVIGYTASLDEDELPTLLAKGKYLDSDNEEKDYTQKIVLDNNTIQLKMFNDASYSRDDPTLGFRITNGQFIMNYTLDFTDKPTFDKLTTTDFPVLGKEYYVLTVNSANDTITLLDSAATAVLSEGDSINLNGKDVSITYVASTEVKLSVDGEVTNSLAEGQTFKLSDGSYVGIKDIMYSAKDTGISQVEFSVGSGKLKIENAQKVEINDEDVKNVYGYVENSSLTLDNLVLKWTADGETFITADQEITMPGFESVKIAFGGVDFPLEETFNVEAGGNDYVSLVGFPMIGGAQDIAILGKAAGNTNYTFVGEESDLITVTSSGSTLTFNGSGSTNDQYFVATYEDTNDAESYLVRATGFNDPSGASDTVDIEYNDGSGWVKKYDDADTDDTISFGQVELTLTNVSSGTDLENVIFTAGTGVSFNTLYSKEGLKVALPTVVTTSTDVLIGDVVPSCGAFEANATSIAASTPLYPVAYYSSVNVHNGSGLDNATCTYGASTYQLAFTEENKDGDKAAGPSFNITIGNNGASNYYASVTDVNNASVTREKMATDVYQSWMYSALSTKFVEQDAGDQDYVEITYHGDETEGNVYVNSADAVIGSGDSGVAILADSSSVSGKNVVVVGGSAINAIAAELVGDVRGPAFTEATGVADGEFLIESFDYNGAIALLVAGYEAEDTTKAATYLTNTAEEITVEAGVKYTGSSATEATLVV